MTTVNDVLDFWFAPESRPEPRHPGGRDLPAWFTADPAFDEAIRRRFLDAYETAARGGLDRWAETPEGALALTVLLDQFPRNMFRGQARAFAADSRALSVAEQAVAKGFDAQVPKAWRKFFYLPFEHAEDSAAQARSVALFLALGEEQGLRYAVLHRDIIERFGRFPHRNAILGRRSTPEEQAWLDWGGETFGTKA
ncbi:MAG: DUF924 family protein [Sphingomonadales bacterium]